MHLDKVAPGKSAITNASIYPIATKISTLIVLGAERLHLEMRKPSRRYMKASIQCGDQDSSPSGQIRLLYNQGVSC